MTCSDNQIVNTLRKEDEEGGMWRREGRGGGEEGRVVGVCEEKTMSGSLVFGAVTKNYVSTV